MVFLLPVLHRACKDGLVDQDSVRAHTCIRLSREALGGDGWQASSTGGVYRSRCTLCSCIGCVDLASSLVVNLMFLFVVVYDWLSYEHQSALQLELWFMLCLDLEYMYHYCVMFNYCLLMVVLCSVICFVYVSVVFGYMFCVCWFISNVLCDTAVYLEIFQKSVVMLGLIGYLACSIILM